MLCEFVCHESNIQHQLKPNYKASLTIEVVSKRNVYRNCLLQRPPTSNSGKENLPFNRKKPWAGWRDPLANRDQTYNIITINYINYIEQSKRVGWWGQSSAGQYTIRGSVIAVERQRRRERSTKVHRKCVTRKEERGMRTGQERRGYSHELERWQKYVRWSFERQGYITCCQRAIDLAKNTTTICVGMGSKTHVDLWIKNDISEKLIRLKEFKCSLETPSDSTVSR